MTDRTEPESRTDGRADRAARSGRRVRGNSSTEVQVLIVGGGIGGLALAGFLRQRGVEPVVVDETAEQGNVGYELCLEGDGLTMLDELGVLDEVVEAGKQVDGWTRRATDGEALKRMSLQDGTPPMTIIERAQLHEQLRTAVPRSTVHTDTTVCTLDQSRGEIEVEFNDGVREQFDVVVGADGVRSRVRELVGAGKKQFCSTTSWTFRIGPDIDTPDSISDIWAPDGKAFFHVPLGERSLGWLVTCTDEREAYDEYTIPDLRETFSGIEWLLPEALDTLDPEEIRHSDDYRIRTDEWVNGRVTLLGDAAHAMHPISGVGASLAIEDAYTLADELAARDDDVAVRLADYVGRRRSRIRQLQHYARLSTPFAATESKLFTAIPDALAVRSYALKSSLGERSRQLSKNGASGTSASGKNSETSEGDDE